MEPSVNEDTLLTPSGFGQAFGIHPEFVELAIRAGAPAIDGSLSLLTLNFWLIDNLKPFRKKASLIDEVLPDSSLVNNHPTIGQIQKVLRVYRDYHIAYVEKLRDFPWTVNGGPKVQRVPVEK